MIDDLLCWLAPHIHAICIAFVFFSNPVKYSLASHINHGVTNTDEEEKEETWYQGQTFDLIKHVSEHKL